ncbi:hypothetical protein EJB05_21714, partial [Eragrostis curvula]
MADDEKRNPEKAGDDEAEEETSRAEEQMNDESTEEEMPEWIKLMRRAGDELEAKRLTWLESKCMGRSDAEAKRQESLESLRKYGLLRPGAVYLEMSDDVDDLEAERYVQPDAETRLAWMRSMGRRGLLGRSYVYIDDQTDYEAVRPILDSMEFLNVPCSYCCCRNKDSKDRPSTDE